MRQHAIYGDEDQEKLAKIFAQEDDIQKLVDISNRQLMKERLKNITKKKKIDTTVNSEKPKEIPQDIPEGEVEFKKVKVEKEPKKKKEKVKKESNPDAIKKLVIIVLLLVVIGVLFGFREEISNGITFVQEKISSTVSSATDETNVGSSSETSGTIGDVINQGKNVNEILRTYYSNLINIAEMSKTEYVAGQISGNYDAVVKDRQDFESFKPIFEQYQGGNAYFETLNSRFTTLENLLLEIQSVDESQIYTRINEAVEQENINITNDRNALITFLEANNVEYTENGQDIITILD